MPAMQSVRTIARSQNHIDAEARSLARALLRECTYLPDSAARTSTKDEVLHWFVRDKKRAVRSYKKYNVNFGGDRDIALPNALTTDLDMRLKIGYAAVRKLQSANNGELTPLKSILVRTYGRTGPYRRQLLAKLLQPDAVENSEVLGHQIKELRRIDSQEWTIESVPVDEVFQQPRLLHNNTVASYIISPKFSKFKAIAESQVKAQPPEFRGKRLRSVEVTIPTKNTWERAMPRNRVKNMVHGAYGKLLDKIMPPIDELEWKRLQGLVHGTIKEQLVRRRRPGITGKPNIMTSEDLEKLAHLESKGQEMEQKVERTSAYDWIKDREAVENAKEEILKDELSLGRPLNKSVQGKERGHIITERLMRTLWQNIFEACPMLSWNTERNAWDVTWGSGTSSKAASKPNEALASLFDYSPKQGAHAHRMK